jgi:hypothetical protein
MREIRLLSGLAQRHFHIKMPSLSRYKGSAVRPGSRTKVSVPLVLPQNRHPERSASQTYRLTEDLRRGVEGPRGCLINACSAELSGHQNYEKIEKVTTSERSRGICGSLSPPKALAEVFFARAIDHACQGLMIGTPVDSKSDTFLVTTVMP